MNKTKLDLAQFEGHTPGPWKATRISDATGKNWIGYEIGQARNLVSKAIARSLGWTETDGGIDSRLIAAAPALLAIAREQQEQIKVLREALKDISLWGNVGGLEDSGFVNLSAAVAKARAALAATEDK